jgi:hypothetical protein
LPFNPQEFEITPEDGQRVEGIVAGLDPWVDESDGGDDLAGFGVLDRFKNGRSASQSGDEASWSWGAEDFVIDRGIPDQVFSNAVPVFSFVIPLDAFRHTDPDAVVSLTATLADGSVLPTWLLFDPLQGRFQGIPPTGFSGELFIRVVARDSLGRQVETLFHLQLLDLEGRGTVLGPEGITAQLAHAGDGRDVLQLGGLARADLPRLH